MANSGELKVIIIMRCTDCHLAYVCLLTCTLQVPAPAVNAVVDLHNPDGLYGLRHRIVAVESL